MSTAPGPAESSGDYDGFAAERQLLATSSYFDADWYRERHPEVAASGLAPEVHYLTIGAAKGLRPSLHFDPKYYRLCAGEMASANPLLHYLTSGRAAGLKPRALFNVSADRLSPEEFPIIDRPTDPAAPIAPALPPLRNAADVETVGRYFSRLSGVPDSGGGPLSAQVLAQASQWLTAGSCRLVDGWYVAEATLRLRFDLEPAATPSVAASTIAAGTFEAVPEAPTQHTVPILSAYQFKPDAGPAMPRCLVRVGRVELGGAGVCFADLALTNPLMPILLVLAEEPIDADEPADTLAPVLDQAGAASLIAFPSLLRKGLHYAEFAASTESGRNIANALALGRNHLAICLADEEKPFAVGRVVVDLSTATGAEAIFSPPLLRWLAAVFGLAVEARIGDEVDDAVAEHLAAALSVSGTLEPARGRRDAAGVLMLPPQAIPTLAALVSRHPVEDARLGHYLVADRRSAMPRAAVSVAANITALEELQPIGAAPLPRLWPAGDGAAPLRGTTSFPLAIALRDPAEPDSATMLAPYAPDAMGSTLRTGFDPDAIEPGDLVVVAVATDQDRTADLLETLAAQSLGDLVTVKLVATNPGVTDGPAAQIAKRFGTRLEIVTPNPLLAPHGLAAVATAGGRYILSVHDGILLHDQRTLETLLTLAAAPGVGAASCVILHEHTVKKRRQIAFASGGWFTTAVALTTAPQLVFGRPNTLDAVVNATYPVVAAGPDLVLYKAEALALIDEITPNPVEAAVVLQLGLKMIEAGYRQLVTTAVRAIALDEPAGHNISDPASPEALPLSRLAELLDHVTTIREVTG